MAKFRILGAIALVALILGIVSLTDMPHYIKYLKGDVINYNTAAAHTLKDGDLVEGVVDAALGCCAEEYETKFGIRTSDDSSKLYYVLWMDNEQFIVYETASKAQYTKLDEITSSTEKYLDALEAGDENAALNVTMQIQGVVETLPSDIEGYFHEWYGTNDSTYSSKCEGVMITNTNLDKLGTSVFIGAGSILVAIILGVVLLVLWRKEKNSNYGY
ncbi:MAG: hypothetical protein PUC41_01600 [Oscillospiraceae bacterium]|nr:hypothetical protein [Oscillospiraceae bacterium]